MTGVSMKVQRKEALYRKLGALGKATFEEVKDANRQSADEMVDLARSYVAVRTGRLRDSIVVTGPGALPPAYSQGAGHQPVPEGAFVVSAGNSGVRYAHLIEYGTQPHVQGGMFAGGQHPGTPRRPFFWPAYRIIRKKLRRRISRALNAAVRKVKGQ